MELIKPIVKVGNSAGVLLPKAWLDGKAKIILLAKPKDIEKELIEALKSYLPNIVSLGIVGSYARREQRESSDIDVLCITNEISKRIKTGKFDILLISEKELRSNLENDVLPLLPMLQEAVPIINGSLLKKYKSTQLTQKNLKWYFETTLSALRVLKEMMDLALIGQREISSNIVYPIVLRLRGVYLVDALMKKKKATTAGFISLLKKLHAPIKAYDIYTDIKKGKRGRLSLNINDVQKLYSYIIQRIREQKKWIKRIS